MNRGIWGAVTLVLGGVIVADLLAHPEGVRQAGASFDSVLRTMFSGMLGGNTTLQ